MAKFKIDYTDAYGDPDAPPLYIAVPEGNAVGIVNPGTALVVEVQGAMVISDKPYMQMARKPEPAQQRQWRPIADAAMFDQPGNLGAVFCGKDEFGTNRVNVPGYVGHGKGVAHYDGFVPTHFAIGNDRLHPLPEGYGPKHAPLGSHARVWMHGQHLNRNVPPTPAGKLPQMLRLTVQMVDGRIYYNVPGFRNANGIVMASDNTFPVGNFNVLFFCIGDAPMDMAPPCNKIATDWAVPGQRHTIGEGPSND